jgi:glucose-6-phosphate 1-dehydrogenase
MPPETKITRSDALVFFGATGDLAFKQIFPAVQALVKHGRLTMPIVAVGRKDVPIEKLRARVKESLAASKDGIDGDAFEKLASQLRYAPVDFDAPKSFQSIRDAIPDAKHPLHYVALPPDVFEKVAVNLANVGLASGARLVLEKPFGHDLASAKALSEALHSSFQEESLFRIDHFLGKELEGRFVLRPRRKVARSHGDRSGRPLERDEDVRAGGQRRPCAEPPPVPDRP